MRTSSFVVAALCATTADAKLSKAEVLQIADGLIKGALEENDLKEYEECFETSEKVTLDIEEGIELIEKKTLSGVTTGIEKIADAVKLIASEVTKCEKSDDSGKLEKLEEMIKQFKTPSSFMWHMGKDLMFNGKDIWNFISDAMTQYKNQKYTDFGRDIGKVLDLVLVGKLELVTAMNPKAYSPEVAQIIEGILVGALNAEGLSNIENCIKDSRIVFDDVEEAVQDFEKKTAAGSTAGLAKVGDAVMEIKTMMSVCPGVEVDVQKLEKMAKIFKNPKTFAYHVGKDLLVDGVQIYGDINKGVEAYKAQQYEQFGEDIGDALALLILGAPTEAYDMATDESIEAIPVEPKSWDFVY